jgi:LmbE family N-acetylglucosaminyl deacetylase
VTKEQETSSIRAAEAGRRILAALADPDRGTLAFRTLLVVAHPDDETIGCGGQLARFSDVTVVHVTDGAPRNGVDAAKLGYSGPADYAAARRRELEAAMHLAGIGSDRLVALGWSDQEAALHLADIARELETRLAGADCVLTHAYEGGHPDHDACALAVHAACWRLRRRDSAPAIIEMPYYRAGPEGWGVHTFIPYPQTEELVIDLDADERESKRAMFACHMTQIQVLARFSIEQERFRQAPNYDFLRLPNEGALLYERENWGMTGGRWLALAGAALAELELREPA